MKSMMGMMSPAKVAPIAARSTSMLATGSPPVLPKTKTADSSVVAATGDATPRKVGQLAASDGKRAPSSTGMSLTQRLLESLASITSTGDKKKTVQPVDPETETLIYYGSQTGTAERAAKELADEGTKNGYRMSVVDLADFNPQDLSIPRYAIFIVATYGDGGPSDNALKFYNWLQKQRQKRFFKSSDLIDLRFTVFGYGNSNFRNYNGMATYTDKALEDLGAQRVEPLGLDDANNMDDRDHFAQWKNRVFTQLIKPPERPKQEGVVETGKARFRIIPCPAPSPEEQSAMDIVDGYRPKLPDKPVGKLLFDAVAVKTLTHKQLCKVPENKSVFLVDLEITGTGITYRPADCVVVVAEQSEQLVERAAQRFNVNLNDWFSLEFPVDAGSGSNPAGGSPGKKRRNSLGNSSGPRPLFPTPCTYRTCLQKYLDLSTTITPMILQQLAPFATDPETSQRMTELAAEANYNAFHQHIAYQGLSILDFLDSYPDINITLEDLVHIVPMIKPSYYTVASSPLAQPDKISLCVGVVSRVLPSGIVKTGLCSTFIKDLQPGISRVRISLLQSKFKLPKLDVPLIMVGVGTGIAPFRAFLQSRMKEQQDGSRVAPSVIFYGCRDDNDFLLADELQQGVDCGVLSHAFVGFSRKENNPKVYVQDLIKQKGDILRKLLIEDKACFFVCGLRRMADEVYNSLIEVLKGGEMTTEQVENFTSMLYSEDRYLQECWG